MQYEKSLGNMGIVFIDVVKKVSCQYSLPHLQRKEFTLRGDCYGLVSVDEGVPEMMSF